jgi:hypothetical protein
MLGLFIFFLLILRPRRWRRNVPPKRRLTFNGPRSVISETITLFIPQIRFPCRSAHGYTDKKSDRKNVMTEKNTKMHSAHIPRYVIIQCQRLVICLLQVIQTASGQDKTSGLIARYLSSVQLSPAGNI